MAYARGLDYARPIRPTTFLVLGVVAGALALAAPAGADTIRVAKDGNDVPDCGRGANQACASVGAALGITPGAQDGDVISIGPGDFAGGVISTNKNVRFVGSGAGTLDSFDPSKDTRLRMPSDSTAALTLGGSGGALEKLPT